MHEVVVGALVRDSRVLLVHRCPTKAAFPSTWDLPGGGIEAGETEPAALARELQEELGVQIAADALLPLCRARAGRPGTEVRINAWLVTDWDGVPVNAAPEEHDDMGWFDVEELPPLAHVTVRAALVEAMRSPSA
ncbi:MAG: NUDIX hydrolase [Cellulomonas sp. 73-145]|uniref:NUDIX domain-containing protein n=1 Tax=Cellulomonas sp. 73-145 TaxID=1895739 RepID=UPI0009267491|nr:NUDIX domain-containing protein [Cellulomonas sp. 73-145]MBN9325821.1 NUDIX domain-containing protein [Cellulomonas sp.]OJV57157.1 MAG: NUDIX hydrolase [Cellulomonas sp. 73-145]